MQLAFSFMPLINVLIPFTKREAPSGPAYLVCFLQLRQFVEVLP